MDGNEGISHENSGSLVGIRLRFNVDDDDDHGDHALHERTLLLRDPIVSDKLDRFSQATTTVQCKHVLFSAYQDDGSNDDVRLPAKLQVSYSTSTRAFSPFNFDMQGQVSSENEAKALRSVWLE